jgi:hypothetical protein
MNNEQARFILRAYRPGGRDAGDPRFGEALHQAQADPALGAWLAREQAFDSAVAAKLRVVAPPPELREAILAGSRVSFAPARPGWRLPAWLAMAASIAVVISGVATYRLVVGGRGATGLDRLAAFALVDPERAHTGPHADRLGTFGAWLENPATRVSSGPPADLAQLKTQGCRSVTIAGREVFEICFRRDGGWYHLYLARGQHPGAWGPVFREEGGRAVAAWADDRLSYVLMTGGGVDALRRIL